MTPRRTCSTPYLPSRAISRMSHWRANVRPMPTAWPFTAAITGLRTCQAGGSRPAALKLRSSGFAKVSEPAAMSTPAQKASPAPVTTTARIASSPSQVR